MSQAELMWSEMSDEVKQVYGKDYFNKKVRKAQGGRGGGS